SLIGDYSFLFGGVAPVNEHDAFTVAVRAKDRVGVAVFGGGVDCAVTPRHGIRADVRFHVSPNHRDTIISAAPSVTYHSPIVAVATSPINTSIQFSNSQSINRKSSLSGPAITDLETFKGSGVDTRMHVAIGYFIRF